METVVNRTANVAGALSWRCRHIRALSHRRPTAIGSSPTPHNEAWALQLCSFTASRLCELRIRYSPSGFRLVSPELLTHTLDAPCYIQFCTLKQHSNANHRSDTFAVSHRSTLSQHCCPVRTLSTVTSGSIGSFSSLSASFCSARNRPSTRLTSVSSYIYSLLISNNRFSRASAGIEAR